LKDYGALFFKSLRCANLTTLSSRLAKNDTIGVSILPWVEIVLKQWIFLGVWILWMGLIFCFSTSSMGDAQTQSWLEMGLKNLLPAAQSGVSSANLHLLNHGLRKLAHFSEYAALTGIGYLAWTLSLKQTRLQSVRIALIGAIAFAISDEFHQRFEAGRTSLITDVMIDSLGATIAALIIFGLWVRSHPSSEKTPS
jgi:VanZ family protein